MRRWIGLLLALGLIGVAAGALIWRRAHDPRRVCEGHLRTLLKACDRVTMHRSHWAWAAELGFDDNQFRYMLAQGDVGPRDWRCPLDTNPSPKAASYCLNPAAFMRDRHDNPTGNLSDDTAFPEVPFLLERGCFHDGQALAINRHGNILTLTPEQLRQVCAPLPSPTP